VHLVGLIIRNILVCLFSTLNKGKNFQYCGATFPHIVPSMTEISYRGTIFSVSCWNHTVSPFISYRARTVSYVAIVLSVSDRHDFVSTRQRHNLSENNIHNIIATIFRPLVTDIYFVKNLFLDRLLYFIFQNFKPLHILPLYLFSQPESMSYPWAVPKALIFHS
jgi:hypothetical protein